MKSAWLIRALDLICSALALSILSVPMALTAWLIRREDGGPALFRQIRVGQGGDHFVVLKFRTMRTQPEALEASTERPSLDARARFQTTRPNDPRITRLGAHLRRTHLDELPQLINVLRGDMSLVGVRPDTPVQEVDYPPGFWRERHRLRPGITGPAQLHADTAGLDERSRLDLVWVHDPTVVRYVAILARTAVKVLKRTGL